MARGDDTDDGDDAGRGDDVGETDPDPAEEPPDAGSDGPGDGEHDADRDRASGDSGTAPSDGEEGDAPDDWSDPTGGDEADDGPIDWTDPADGGEDDSDSGGPGDGAPGDPGGGDPGDGDGDSGDGAPGDPGDGDGPPFDAPPGSGADDGVRTELDRLWEELEGLEGHVDDRTVSKSTFEREMRAYVRRRIRRGHARGWGPYLVLLYGTAMTLGAFYYLDGLWAILAMVVLWLSTLGLYTLMVLVGVGLGVLGTVWRVKKLLDSLRSRE